MTTEIRIYAQLRAAQSQFRAAPKDANNPHFKSRYASLLTLWETCKDALHANGLCISHNVRRAEGGGYECVTRLYNDAGESLESTFPLLSQQQGPQPMGSALTYARRYSLAALLGLVTDDEDDDGNAAQAPAKQKQGSAGVTTAANAAPQKATEKQEAQIRDLMQAKLSPGTELANQYGSALKRIEAGNWITQKDGPKRSPFDAAEAMIASLTQMSDI